MKRVSSERRRWQCAHQSERGSEGNLSVPTTPSQEQQRPTSKRHTKQQRWPQPLVQAPPRWSQGRGLPPSLQWQAGPKSLTLSPASGLVKDGLTLDAGLREAVEEGFLVVELGLVVPTLEGGLEPARREAGLDVVPSTAFDVGFAFEAGLAVTLDAGLVALEAGFVALEAGLVALEAGLVFWEPA